MPRSAAWEELFVAKLLMRLELPDLGRARAAIHDAIAETDAEEARVKTPEAAESSGQRRMRKVSARSTTGAQTLPDGDPKPGTTNGLTQRVSRIFDDGEEHTLEDLEARTGATRKQIKRAIHRLVHDHKTIKRVGSDRSGCYIKRSNGVKALGRRR